MKSSVLAISQACSLLKSADTLKVVMNSAVQTDEPLVKYAAYAVPSFPAQYPDIQRHEQSVRERQKGRVFLLDMLSIKLDQTADRGFIQRAVEPLGNRRQLLPYDIQCCGHPLVIRQQIAHQQLHCRGLVRRGPSNQHRKEVPFLVLVMIQPRQIEVAQNIARRLAGLFVGAVPRPDSQASVRASLVVLRYARDTPPAFPAVHPSRADTRQEGISHTSLQVT